MAPRGDQTNERGTGGAGVDAGGHQVAFDVVDAEEWNVERLGHALADLESDEQRADEAGAKGGRHRDQIRGLQPCVVQGAVDDLVHPNEVLA